MKVWGSPGVSHSETSLHSAPKSLSRLSFKQSQQTVALAASDPGKQISAVTFYTDLSRFQGDDLPYDPISLVSLRKVIGFHYLELLSCKDRIDDF